MLTMAPSLRVRPRHRVRPVPATADGLTAADRRTLGGVLGFLVALAAFGPLAGVAGACLGALVARIADPR